MNPYRERLWPGPSAWAGAAVLAGGLGLVALPLGTPAAVVTVVVALGLVVAALVAWRPVVLADAAGLRVGSRVVPMASVVGVEALGAEEMRRRAGPEADARTRTVLRPGIATGIHGGTTDGGWLVACRRPDLVVSAMGREL